MDDATALSNLPGAATYDHYSSFRGSKLQFRYTESHSTGVGLRTFDILNCSATGAFWSSYATGLACLTRFKIALSCTVHYFTVIRAINLAS